MQINRGTQDVSMDIVRRVPGTCVDAVWNDGLHGQLFILSGTSERAPQLFHDVSKPIST